MEVALDTNILLRLQEPSGERRDQAHRAVKALLGQDADFLLLPPALVEFWTVCTRPERSNGLGLEPDEADRRLAVYERM